ncbi:MAG: hypothetical protein ACOX5G_08935 [Kiritimatiellia bacterium]|jgi:hypothetical protein
MLAMVTIAHAGVEVHPSTFPGSTLDEVSPEAKGWRHSGDADAWRSSLLNVDVLKRHFINIFAFETDVARIDETTWGDACQFRERMGLSDEHLSAALIKVYREAAERKRGLSADNRDVPWHERYQHKALVWLGVCSDLSARAFLLEVATDTSEESCFRTAALLSYIRVASPDETKQALIRFLIEDDRMDPQQRAALYGGAREVYAEAGTLKRRAIRSSFIVAATHEETRGGFEIVDGVLAGWDDVYRRSHERLALMGQHAGEDAEQQTGYDVTAVFHVHTNLAALKAVNLSDWGTVVGTSTDDQSQSVMLDLAADRLYSHDFRDDRLYFFLVEADAEGAKQALIRFLVGADRLQYPYRIYWKAMENIFKEADELKQRAIFATLQVAVAREDKPGEFLALDDLLVRRSDSYRRSRQRLHLLESHALRMPHDPVCFDRSLLVALADARKFWRRTDVNMSLADLQAQDFGRPLSAQEIEQWGGTLNTGAIGYESSYQSWASESSMSCSRAVWCGLIAVAGVILAVPVCWRLGLRRKRKAGRFGKAECESY